jgi:DNA-binding NarL/FixJ family response regulator
MMQALVVEDTDLVARGMVSALSEAGIAVAAIVATLEEALQQPLPDVVLLDIGLPDTCRLETVGLLKRRWPDVPVLVVTVYLNVDIALWVLREGALGFVAKDIRSSALGKALETVNGNEHFILPELAAEFLQRQPRAGKRGLRQEERRVLGYLADGLDIERVAVKVGSSRRLVGSLLAEAIEQVTPVPLTAGEMRALLAIDTALPNKVAARLLGMNEKNLGALLTSLRTKMGLPPGETRLLSQLANRLHAGCALSLEDHLERYPSQHIPVVPDT